MGAVLLALLGHRHFRHVGIPPGLPILELSSKRLLVSLALQAAQREQFYCLGRLRIERQLDADVLLHVELAELKWDVGEPVPQVFKSVGDYGIDLVA